MNADVPTPRLLAAIRSCTDRKDTAMTDALCDDRGPRIGSEGAPHCRRLKGHAGSHRPAPEDGWGPVTWSNLIESVDTPSDNITELRRVQAGEREVMDLLHIDAGHHPWVRLSLEQWACVDGIAQALAAARVPAPRNSDTTGGTR